MHTQALSRPHRVLGVRREASKREVTKAYRKLARKLHPDRNPAPDAAERFAEVTAARDLMIEHIDAGTLPEETPAPPPPRWDAEPPISPEPQHVSSVDDMVATLRAEMETGRARRAAYPVVLYAGAALFWVLAFMGLMRGLQSISDVQEPTEVPGLRAPPPRPLPPLSPRPKRRPASENGSR
ncbi:MAG: J domain-containing protein [Myxococcales bacterium]|nr:J domain-containing protein [Myxococcales bacterium]